MSIKISQAILKGCLENDDLENDNLENDDVQNDDLDIENGDDKMQMSYSWQITQEVRRNIPLRFFSALAASCELYNRT